MLYAVIDRDWIWTGTGIGENYRERFYLAPINLYVILLLYDVSCVVFTCYLRRCN